MSGEAPRVESRDAPQVVSALTPEEMQAVQVFASDARQYDGHGAAGLILRGWMFTLVSREYAHERCLALAWFLYPRDRMPTPDDVAFQWVALDAVGAPADLIETVRRHRQREPEVEPHFAQFTVPVTEEVES